MERGNHTVTKLILLGFMMQLVLIVVFLNLYSVTLDARLHTPMYFFIGNLTFLDLWLPIVYTPKTLVTFISEEKSISFSGSVAQFFSTGLGYTACYLLAAMAYHHYVTISIKLCPVLLEACYLGGFTNSSVITKTFSFDFCKHSVIDDFLCELLPLVKLACGRLEGSQTDVLPVGLQCHCPLALILVSYLFSIATILRIQFTQSRLKAFSTFFSHLVSVTLYYDSILFIYFCPNSIYSLERDKMASIFYTVLFLMLNPLIYNLRNKDMKEALHKIFR
uniref:G-protein coupled receptors family 1 profile domain-containing protein n=1 Tax=Cavia porcellus TaxID=10141 RepID=A0A286XF69_CAVPO